METSTKPNSVEPPVSNRKMRIIVISILVGLLTILGVVALVHAAGANKAAADAAAKDFYAKVGPFMGDKQYTRSKDEKYCRLPENEILRPYCMAELKYQANQNKKNVDDSPLPTPEQIRAQRKGPPKLINQTPLHDEAYNNVKAVQLPTLAVVKDGETISEPYKNAKKASDRLQYIKKLILAKIDRSNQLITTNNKRYEFTHKLDTYIYNRNNATTDKERFDLTMKIAEDTNAYSKSLTDEQLKNFSTIYSPEFSSIYKSWVDTLNASFQKFADHGKQTGTFDATSASLLSATIEPIGEFRKSLLAGVFFDYDTKSTDVYAFKQLADYTKSDLSGHVSKEFVAKVDSWTEGISSAYAATKGLSDAAGVKQDDFKTFNDYLKDHPVK